MSSTKCIPWQGNLACLSSDGVVMKSRHTINGEHVFGPDSDYTTLAISGLQLLIEETNISAISIDDSISELVISACGYLVDKDAEWSIVCGDDSSISISKGRPLNGISEGEEIDPVFHSEITDAWNNEMNEVSQGAFVSEQGYLENISARMNLQSQSADGIPIWPPREMVGEIVPTNSTSLAKNGTIESWTRLSAAGAPSEFALRAPILGGLCTVFVKLKDGPTGVFLLADDESNIPEIGSNVELAIRRIYAQDGLIRHGLKALIVN